MGSRLPRARRRLHGRDHALDARGRGVRQALPPRRRRRGAGLGRQLHGHPLPAGLRTDVRARSGRPPVPSREAGRALRGLERSVLRQGSVRRDDGARPPLRARGLRQERDAPPLIAVHAAAEAPPEPARAEPEHGTDAAASDPKAPRPAGSTGSDSRWSAMGVDTALFVALSLAAFYLVPIFLTGARLPLGSDAAYYTWMTRLAGYAGLAPAGFRAGAHTLLLGASTL